MKFPLFSLLIICFGISALTKSSPQQIDKFSYIMNTLTRPYSTAIGNMRTKAESSYRHFQNLISSGLADELAEEEASSSSNKRSPKTIKPKENNDIEVSSEEETEGSSRMLATSCSSASIAVNANVNVYACNGKEVSRASYDAVNGVGCNVTTKNKNLCYCPYDYYGDRCEKRNTYTCEIQRISHPLNCQGTDSYAYVYSYNGIPPCYKVESGANVVFKTKAVCTSGNSQYDFEGVKPSIYEVVEQPTVSTNFTYVVSNDRFRLTSLNSSTVSQKISFTNWKRMSSPVTITTPITLDQIAGNSEITTNINFQDAALAQTVASGRYYFELSLTSSGTPSFSNSGYNGGFFEQAGYREPAPAKKSSKVLVIVLPTLGAILLIGLLVGYKLYQKKKERQEQRLAAENAPLVQDE